MGRELHLSVLEKTAALIDRLARRVEDALHTVDIDASANAPDDCHEDAGAPLALMAT